MQIKNEEHYKNTWKVHALLPDFEVEDVWQFPVELNEDHSIYLFQMSMMKSMEALSQKGVASWLFKLRFFLGRIFGWDEKNEAQILLEPGSIRERYAEMEGIKGEALPAPGNEDFIPVYTLENESLAEIKNATVHAGLHLSKVPNGDKYTVHMAVYVKPNGLFGRMYMALIKPFRLAIVYPIMMKMVGKQWNKTITEGIKIA